MVPCQEKFMKLSNYNKNKKGLEHGENWEKKENLLVLNTKLDYLNEAMTCQKGFRCFKLLVRSVC